MKTRALVRRPRVRRADQDDRVGRMRPTPGNQQPTEIRREPPLLPGSAQRSSGDPEGGRRPRKDTSGSGSKMLPGWPGATDDRSGRVESSSGVAAAVGRRRRVCATRTDTAVVAAASTTAAVTAMATDLKPNASSNSNHSPNSRNSRPVRTCSNRSGRRRCSSSPAPIARPSARIMPRVVPIHTPAQWYRWPRSPSPTLSCHPAQPVRTTRPR